MLLINQLIGSGARYYDAACLASAIFIDPSALNTMWQETTGTSGTAVVVNGPVGSIRNRGTLGGIARAPTTGRRPILRNSGGQYWLETTTSAQSELSLSFTSQTTPVIWWANGIRYESTSSQWTGFGSWKTEASADFDWSVGEHVVGGRNGGSPSMLITRGGSNSNSQSLSYSQDHVTTFLSSSSARAHRRDLLPYNSTGNSYGNHVVDIVRFFSRATGEYTNGRFYGFVARFTQPSTSEEDQIIRSIALRQGRSLKVFSLSSVSSNFGSVDGGTPITITGTNFPVDPAVVTVGGAPATNVVRVSSTSITAVTPAGAVGLKDVSVSINGQIETLTSAFNYGRIIDIIPAAAAYGTRKLRESYTGSALRVRRSSDNAEADIGFSGEHLNEAALLSHIGSSSGFVTILYDQSGNGRNLVQTTQANQPIIANSGVLVKNVGSPRVTLDLGANARFMQTSAAATWINGGGYTIHALSRLNTTALGSECYICGTNQSTNDAGLHVGWYNSSTRRFAQYFTNYDIADTPTTNQTTSIYTRTGTSAQIYQNGVLLGTGSNSFPNPLNTSGVFNFGKGYTTSAGGGHKGTISELIVRNVTSDSTQLQYIDSNQQLYYMTPPFNITSVNPPVGPAAGGTTITISGVNFTSGMTVTIGGVACTSVTLVNSTTITAVTPSGSVGAKDLILADTSGWIFTLTSGFAYGQIVDLLPASAAYSLRKLRENYAGSAIRVRRSSDNAVADIGFSGVNLNTTALLAHCGSGSGFITTWYDQSGNGRNLSQATTANQPRIVNAGTVDTQGSVPCIVYDSTDRLEIGTWGDIAQPYTQNGVIRTGASNANFPVMVGPSNESTYTNAITYIETNFATIGPFTDTNGPRLPVTTNERLIFTSSFNGSNTNFAKNGTVTANGYVGNGTLSGVRLAGPGVTYQEIIIFERVLSTFHRQTLERNQGTYHGITVI